MSSKGWIKVHRKIKNNPIWQDPHYLKLWMYCLVEASHKEREQFVGNDIVKILPGQFVTGRISLAEDLNNGMQPKKRQSESTWWRHLNKLKDWQMLNIKTNNKYSVVTIANWEVYQDHEKEATPKRTADEQQMNSKRTADEQQMNTNKNVKNLRIKELKNKDLNVQSRKPNFEPHHLKLAELLFKKIKENNPTAKGPNLKSWANTFRLMMERDKREGKEIQELIIWTQEHHFWYQNILSANKLREQYDRLKLQMKDDGLKVVNGGLNKKEVIPDWFNNRDKPNEAPTPQVDAEQAKKEREKLEALMREYSGS